MPNASRTSFQAGSRSSSIAWWWAPTFALTELNGWLTCAYSYFEEAGVPPPAVQNLERCCSYAEALGSGWPFAWAPFESAGQDRAEWLIDLCIFIFRGGRWGVPPPAVQNLERCCSYAEALGSWWPFAWASNEQWTHGLWYIVFWLKHSVKPNPTWYSELTTGCVLWGSSSQGVGVHIEE